MKKDDISQVMDRGAERIRQLHDVSGWLLEHWGHIPKELYKFNRGSFEPVDVLEYLTELMRQDLANAVSVAINWHEFRPELKDGDKETPEDSG